MTDYLKLKQQLDAEELRILRLADALLHEFEQTKIRLMPEINKLTSDQWEQLGTEQPEIGVQLMGRAARIANQIHRTFIENPEINRKPLV